MKPLPMAVGLGLLTITLTAAAPPPAGGQLERRAPRVVSRTIETRMVGAGGLEKTLREIGSSGAAAWVGWTAPVIEGRHRMCCFDSIDHIDDKRCCHQCRLEDKQSSGTFSINDDKVDLEPSGRFVVVARVSGRGGEITRLGGYSEDCELNTGRLPFFWLDGVTADQSLDYLTRFVTGGRQAAGKQDDDEKMIDDAFNVIALHGTPAADRLLERFVARGQPFEVREKAAFWLGVSRGRAGYETLRRLVLDDPDDEMRKKAIFALSQNSTPESTDALIGVAHADRASDVRGEAVFWLSQKAGDKAARAITEAIENDPETEVKKKAVFALSQLPAEQGVPLLIDLAGKHRNPAVRKEAIFWLGQSGDPRALDFIEKILKG